MFSQVGALRNIPYSGLYSYICNFYKIPFQSYSLANSFDEACKDALTILEKNESFKPCFDYIFIDESQDFSDGFFDLCEKVTVKTIFIAGDIFQNIFDTTEVADINPDYLLNNC